MSSSGDKCFALDTPVGEVTSDTYKINPGGVRYAQQLGDHPHRNKLYRPSCPSFDTRSFQEWNPRTPYTPMCAQALK